MIELNLDNNFNLLLTNINGGSRECGPIFNPQPPIITAELTIDLDLGEDIINAVNNDIQGEDVVNGNAENSILHLNLNLNFLMTMEVIFMKNLGLRNKIWRLTSVTSV